MAKVYQYQLALAIKSSLFYFAFYFETGKLHNCRF